jgi:hypothetical protein
MTTEASAEAKGGLKSAFQKANHWRHIIMDISMVGMAVGLIVASGGMTGFLDPLWAFAKMHVSGIPDLFTHGPAFLADAFNNAANGVWFTGAEVSHTAMHGGMAPTATHQAMGAMYGADPNTLSALSQGHP